MTKTELVDSLAKKLDTTKKFAGQMLDMFFEEVTSVVKNGEKLVVPGFGTWGAKDRAARAGRNPQTGAKIQIAAARVPYFRAGSLLKAAANTKGAKAKAKK